jgi:hypothetical protein
MPFYEFLNNDTNEVETHTMKISELDAFVEANPQLQRYHSGATPFGDAWRLGITKPDSTFEKYVIQRMRDTVPGNQIKDTHKTKIPREW